MANHKQIKILMSGVEAWNTYRRDNPGVPIDLRGAANLDSNVLKPVVHWEKKQDRVRVLEDTVKELRAGPAEAEKGH